MSEPPARKHCTAQIGLWSHVGSASPRGAAKDKTVLRRWARSTAPASLARRARIVLLAGDGVPNAEIARRVGVSRPTVIGWRDRYLEGQSSAPRPNFAREKRPY